MLTMRRSIVIALGLGAFIAASYVISPMFARQTPATQIASQINPTRKLEHFALTDTNGNAFTEKSLRGHWTLMFFGYKNCPDICPATLNLVRKTWDMFPNDQHPARFVFVNIDTTPTSQAEFKQFLTSFNQNFIGLDGTPAEIRQLRDQLGIYANPQNGKIDHTAALMLIDPHARLSAIFTPPFTASELAQDLRALTK